MSCSLSIVIINLFWRQNAEGEGSEGNEQEDEDLEGKEMCELNQRI